MHTIFSMVGIYCFIVFDGIGDIRGGHIYRTRRARGIGRSLATFREVWMSRSKFASITCHSTGDLTTLFVSPPEDTKIGRTRIIKYHCMVQELEGGTDSSRNPDSKSRGAYASSPELICTRPTDTGYS